MSLVPDKVFANVPAFPVPSGTGSNPFGIGNGITHHRRNVLPVIPVPFETNLVEPTSPGLEDMASMKASFLEFQRQSLQDQENAREESQLRHDHMINIMQEGWWHVEDHPKTVVYASAEDQFRADHNDQEEWVTADLPEAGQIFWVEIHTRSATLAGQFKIDAEAPSGAPIGSEFTLGDNDWAEEHVISKLGSIYTEKPIQYEWRAGTPVWVKGARYW